MVNKTFGHNRSQSFVPYGADMALQRVSNSTVSSDQLIISAETVNFAAGAAGTSGVVGLDKAPIYNATGTELGHYISVADNNTSFAWVTGTILTAQVRWRDDQTDTVQLAALTNGQYAINYDTGKLRYKKATAGTSDTCNYNVRATFLSADIEVGAVEIKDGDSDTRMDVITQDAAFGTATNGLAFFGKYQATPTTYTDNDAAPILLDANGRIVLSSDIEIGAVEIKDNDSETRVEVHAPNTAATIAGLNVYPARYMATPPTITDTFTTPLLTDNKANLKITAVADIPTAITAGQQTVTTPGTAVALAASTACKSVIVCALLGNTSTINVGGSTVDYLTNPGVPLYPGDSIPIAIDDLAKVFIDATVALEGASFVYVV